MQLKSLVLLLIAAGFVNWEYPLNAVLTQSTPTPVEVWCRGDDGLTVRLRDALESQFKLAPDFRLSSGKKSGTLIVTIPGNVDWKDEGKRTHVLYTIEFTTIDNQSLGSSKGSCWDNDLRKCAIQILKNARSLAPKIR